MEWRPAGKVIKLSTIMAEPTWVSRHTGETYDIAVQYDRTHLVTAVYGIITAGILVVAARRVNGQPLEMVLRRVIGLVYGVVALVYFAYILRSDRVVYDETLPFHFTDVLRVITPLSIATGDDRAVSLSFYWGFILNSMAILSPDAAWVADRRVQETAYWGFHWGAIIVPIMMTFGFGYRPTWQAFYKVIPFTIGWSALASVANVVTGGNYTFTARKPRGASALDYLGPWPVYIIAGSSLIVSAWAGMTWWSDTSGAGGRLSRRGLLRRV